MEALAADPRLGSRDAADGALPAALAICVLSLNALALQIVQSCSLGPSNCFGGLLGINAFVWFALFGMVRIALEGNTATVVIAARDRSVFVATAICALTPLRLVSAIALPMLAVWLLVTAVDGSRRHRIGLIGLALAGPILFGPAIRALFAPELTAFEAGLLQVIPGLSIEGNVITASDRVTHLVVAGGCSATANISLAILLVTTLFQVFAIHRRWLLLRWIVVAVAGVVGVNCLRLATLALNPANVVYYHTGAGRSLFDFAAFTTIALIAIAGTVDGLRR